MPASSDCEVSSFCGKVVSPPAMDVASLPSHHEAENTNIKKGKKPSRKTKSAEDVAAQCFPAHKQKVLQDLSLSYGDRSPKHSVDEKCLSLLKLLNTHLDYVTTSSCSGRIAFFHSIEEEADETRIPPTTSSCDVKKSKRGGVEAKGWLFVKHGMLTPPEMEVLVYYFCGPPNSRAAKRLDERHRREADQCFTMASRTGNMRWYGGEWSGSDPRLLDLLVTHAHPSDGLHTSCLSDDGSKDDAIPSSLSLSSSSSASSSSSCEVPLCASSLPLSPPLLFSRGGLLESFPSPPSVGNIALKMEPFVLHVQCRTIEAGKLLLNAAISDSGYRNSGLIPPGNKVMCAIRTAVGLGMDVPLQLDGHNYVRSRSEKGRTKEKRNKKAMEEPLAEIKTEKGLRRRHSSTASQGRAYLWTLLHRANQKIKANEEKMMLLEKSLKHRLTGNSPRTS